MDCIWVEDGFCICEDSPCYDKLCLYPEPDDFDDCDFYDEEEE